MREDDEDVGVCAERATDTGGWVCGTEEQAVLDCGYTDVLAQVSS